MTTAATSSPRCRPGTYTLVAEARGFKKYTRAGIRLDLGRTTTLDLPLEVGGLAETVTITAATPLVDVTSKQIGGNVTNREVTSLPSVNGNFVGMVALLPGMVANISTESFGSDAVSANGMDSRNNNFLLDGANNNDDVIGQRAGGQARTPLEAIAEFQVVTNQYDAEFGRTTGAIINAISKQGTNQLHGVAAGLWQDASMTSRDFFVKQNGLTKPNTSLQTYRANLGGPIIRDKAHGFFNIERVMVDRATTITIPSHPELNASPVTQDRVWNTLARFDHQVTPNNTWTVRWLRDSSPQLNQIVPYLPPFPGAQTLPVTTRASREEHDVDQTVVVSANTVLGNTRLNTIRVNFTREDVAFANPGFNGNGQDQAALDPQLVFLTYVDQQNNVAQARVNDAYQIDDTFSWFIAGRGGSHDLKFGLQYQYIGARSTAQDNLNGTFFFRSDAAFNAASGSTYPERLQIRVPNALELVPEGAFRLGVRAGQVAPVEPRDNQRRPPLRPRGPAVQRTRQPRLPGSDGVPGRHEQPRAAPRDDLRPERRRPRRRPWRLRPFLRQDPLRTDFRDPHQRRVLRLVQRVLPDQQRRPRTVERDHTRGSDARRGPHRQSRAARAALPGRIPHPQHRDSRARQPGSAHSLHRSVHRRLRTPARHQSVGERRLRARARPRPADAPGSQPRAAGDNGPDLDASSVSIPPLPGRSTRR